MFTCATPAAAAAAAAAAAVVGEREIQIERRRSIERKEIKLLIKLV